MPTKLLITGGAPLSAEPTAMHRGPHPEDAELFGPAQWPILRQATADYAWLLTRGYSKKAGLTLVGDHFQLSQRQRVAVARCTCTEQARQSRRDKQFPPRGDECLEVDGLNVLTTVEAALAGGVVLEAQDGCFRDMAAFHGNYRLVEEVEPALLLIGASLAAQPVRWWLDRPVSNTGRLAALIRDLAARQGWMWEVELVPDPDAVLRQPGRLVATSDSAILDRAERWFNLARTVVTRHVPDAWRVDLS